jgi:hypothetical protein
MYTVDEHQHIVSGEPLDGLRELKDEGLVRFIGIIAEERGRPGRSSPSCCDDCARGNQTEHVHEADLSRSLTSRR